MPWLFLIASVVGAWFTYNAFRPVASRVWLAGVSFFAGWLTTELAVHHLVWQAAMTLVFVWAGALQAWPGFLGLCITLISWGGLARLFWRAREAEAVVENALQEALGHDYRERISPAVATTFAPGIDWRQVILPVPVRHGEVERIPNITYTRSGRLDLKLDIYRHRRCAADSPTLLQVHGGAWVVGSKNEQGLPLMIHLAARGWVCVSVNYRLSPYATFPDQVIDLKRSIAWIREHGPEYGANPDFLVVTGGSAGGHLAALTALTANASAYQPGFETVDTSVQGCVAFYGVYDLTDRHRSWAHAGLRKLLERLVVKASLEEAAHIYEEGSPISRLHRDAPPFLVVHGDKDTVVPIEHARRFAEAFHRHAHGRIAYAEIPGAQHAFEIFPSSRALFVIHGVERFLAYLYSEHLSARSAIREPVGPPEAVVELGSAGPAAGSST